MADETGLKQALSETPKTSFVATRPILTTVLGHAFLVNDRVISQFRILQYYDKLTYYIIITYFKATLLVNV